MFIEHRQESWSTGQLSDLISVKYGKDHKKLADGNYPVYGSGGIMRYVEKPLYTGESVLIPRKGTLNNVMYVNEAFWSVDTMFYTEMLRPNIAKFVYHFVKSKDLASLNAGSAVPSMTTNILNAMQLYIPDEKTLEKFENIVSPMYSAMQKTQKNPRFLPILVMHFCQSLCPASLMSLTSIFKPLNPCLSFYLTQFYRLSSLEYWRSYSVHPEMGLLLESLP